jgi:hypothetical protein
LALASHVVRAVSLYGLRIQALEKTLGLAQRGINDRPLFT